MTRKSTATKTTATKSSTQTTTRKSTAARTKLPAVAVETVAAVETLAVVETVVVETLAVVEAPVVVAPAARVVSRDEFELMVRREAYQRAERRAFRNGTAFEDWIRAEAVVRDLLIADGALLA